MHSNFSVNCAHGHRMIDADECQECLKMEVAKKLVLNTVDDLIRQYTDEDDGATRALVATAAGHYVSMKLKSPADSARVLNGMVAVIQQALPCGKEERMLAQQHFLTALSFEAYEPEELECRYSLTWGQRLLGWLQGKTQAIYKPQWTRHNSKLLLP